MHWRGFPADAEKPRLQPGLSDRNGARLCLDDFAALDAAGADTQLLCAAFDLSLDRAKIDVPAPLSDVVRVRDVVTELRAFAADFADLSHDSLQKS